MSVLVCKDSFSCNASEQGEAVAEGTQSVGAPQCHCCWNFHGCVDGAEGEVLLVSSSRHPDRWIVPGGGMEPEEEPGVAAVREVCEEAGVKGTLGRLVGIFENRDRKHRTYVYVLIVTEVLEDWEDSVNIGRKREWFKIEDAIKVLQYHKPVQASYFETLRQGCLANNGTPVMSTPYSESSVSDIR
ncbi:diphosphoinositol polyphosphate phosphohydrolase 1 isoform X1 [Agelaius phoeniceus]|uniref:diphosphoinositol polyphosphate phosphohydrolase 1 isoform X1 n=1 Tax=Agelaius phoeniceus TaxID=39638 RepID=UPI004054A9DD